MNPYSSSVNQKLYFAKLLVNAGKSSDGSLVHLELALSQSAVFQLFCAYQLYLNEIAANYRAATDPPIINVAQLCEALLNIDKHPAEAQELSHLEQQPGSWLNQLLSCYSSVIETSSLANNEVAGRIPLQSIDKPSGALKYSTIEQIIAGFTELIERQRELMLEC